MDLGGQGRGGKELPRQGPRGQPRCLLLRGGEDRRHPVRLHRTVSGSHGPSPRLPRVRELRGPRAAEKRPGVQHQVRVRHAHVCHPPRPRVLQLRARPLEDLRGPHVHDDPDVSRLVSNTIFLNARINFQKPVLRTFFKISNGYIQYPK